jgi:hypothetical protein
MVSVSLEEFEAGKRNRNSTSLYISKNKLLNVPEQPVESEIVEEFKDTRS